MICSKPYQKIVQKLHQDYMCLTFLVALYKIRRLRVNFPAVVGLRVVWGGLLSVFRSAVVRWSVVRLFCPVWAFSVAGGLLFACCPVVPCGGCCGACMGCGGGAVCSCSESVRLSALVGVPCLCGAVCCRGWVFLCLIRSWGLWGLLGGFITVFQAP